MSKLQLVSKQGTSSSFWVRVRCSGVPQLSDAKHLRSPRTSRKIHFRALFGIVSVILIPGSVQMYLTRIRVACSNSQRHFPSISFHSFDSPHNKATSEAYWVIQIKQIVSSFVLSSSKGIHRCCSFYIDHILNGEPIKHSVVHTGNSYSRVHLYTQELFINTEYEVGTQGGCPTVRRVLFRPAYPFCVRTPELRLVLQVRLTNRTTHRLYCWLTARKPIVLSSIAHAKHTTNYMDAMLQEEQWRLYRILYILSTGPSLTDAPCAGTPGIFSSCKVVINRLFFLFGMRLPCICGYESVAVNYDEECSYKYSQHRCNCYCSACMT